MARLPDLLEFAAEHKLKIGTIADLIEYRSRNESLVQRAARARYRDALGQISTWCRTATCRSVPSTSRWCSARSTPKKETLVRVHEPLSIIDLLDVGQEHALVGRGRRAAGDPAGRQRRDGADELQPAGRGARAGLARPPKAGRSADLRLYGIGAQILRDLGVGRMRLMAAPRKMPSMAGFGLEVVGYLSDPRRRPARRSAERHAPRHRRQPLQRGDHRRAARAARAPRRASWASKSTSDQRARRARDSRSRCNGWRSPAATTRWSRSAR